MRITKITKYQFPILGVSLLAITIITGLTLSPAFAILGEEVSVGDEIVLKGKASGTCTSGEGSDTAKANVRFLLQVTESEDGNYNGVVKSDFKGIKANCDGIPRSLVNDGPLAFSYDGNSNVIIILGQLIGKDGSVFTLDGLGEYVVKPNNKISVDLHIELVGTDDVSTNLTVVGGKVFH